MSDYATKTDVQTIVDKAVDDLAGVIQAFAKNVDERFDAVDARFEQVDERFESIDERFDAVDARFEQVDERFESIDARFDGVDTHLDKIDDIIASLDKKYDHLITTLDAFLKRLDDIEADNIARDAQLARLERWIEQVAAKSGVKLEY